jgi:hypothetical protein
MSTTMILSALLCLTAVSGAAAHGGDALVDPTRPGSAAAPRRHTGGLQVQAIITRAGARIAIVDGQLVHAGDHLANVVIEEVTPEGIRYSKNNGRMGFARLPGREISIRRVTVAQKGVP